MDLVLSVMFNKSMNFIKRLNRGNFYLPKQSFKIWWLIRGMEVIKQISAEYL